MAKGTEDKRPTSVRIGGIDYDLQYVERPQDQQNVPVYGCIDGGTAAILLDNRMAPGPERQSLWHEVIHGLLYNAGLQKHDERTVDALAYGIIQVLRDNPWLGR